jgi:hypothetical protein
MFHCRGVFKGAGGPRDFNNGKSVFYFGAQLTTYAPHGVRLVNSMQNCAVR